MNLKQKKKGEYCSMYIIKYEQNSIYAGTWNDTEGSYLYASNSLNKQKRISSRYPFFFERYTGCT